MADHVLANGVIRAYAELSHDHKALHVDDLAATLSPFGSIVAHGFLLLSGALVEAATNGGYPKALECRFQSPGRPGDLLHTTFDAEGAFTVEIKGDDVVTGRLTTAP